MKKRVVQRTPTECAANFSRPSSDTLLVSLQGKWKIAYALPSPDEVQKELDSGTGAQRLAFDSQDLTDWDSGLLTFLIKVFDQCSQRKIEVDKQGLPEGVRRLLALAAAVPEKTDAHGKTGREPYLARVGAGAVDAWRAATAMLAFLGDSSLAFIKFLTGRARLRRSDLFRLLQDCGADALPIVTLISFLVGLILAFVGAVQLKMFGAQIYVANLVGIAMVREMGAMMTGIVMAGRTGAAFAAQIGTMQVNEEIDALSTMGVSPMEFLVVPRMFALVVMMPLLCLYANLMGILGGVIVGVGMLDISLPQYLDQTTAAVSLTDLSLGIVKAGIFGVLVAISGCLRGIECGRSASAVGDAATSAVVTAMVAIIVTDGIFAVLTNIVGI